MNCPYCGSANLEGSTTCANCGQPIGTAAPMAPAPPAPSESYGQPPAPPGYAPPPAPPAGYAQPGYAPSQGAGLPPMNSHLVMAILVTLLCCMPFGVVGIVFASQVNSKLAMGDFAGAQSASKNAALWSWLGIGAAALVAVVYLAVVMLAVVSSTSSGSSF